MLVCESVYLASMDGGFVLGVVAISEWMSHHAVLSRQLVE